MSALSKTLNISLWIAQFLLSLSMLWAAYTKWFTPIEQLAQMWPWTGQTPLALVYFTGFVDLLGGIGLILPGIVGTDVKWSGRTAIGIVVLMIFAAVFHISRSEAKVLAPNVIFAAIAAFIAWGRLKKQAK